MNQVVNPPIEKSLPAYCLHFGWSVDPFCTQSDKAPYYIPSSWDQYLDVIQHVYQHENALITIIGPSGCGKSTLLKQTLLQIDSNILTSVHLANHKITPETLLLTLTHEFNVTLPMGDSLEERYDNLLTTLQLNAQSCLLIFDNAHLLSLEVIQQIYYCLEQQTDYQMRLHFILIGDPSLKQLMDTAGYNRTKQLKIHNILMKKFNQYDTAQYLRHRIKNIDQHSQLPFENEVINYIQTHSSGYPAQINKTAAYVLQHPIKQQRKISSPKKQSPSFTYQFWQIASLLSIVVICALGFYFKAMIKPASTVKPVIHKATLIHTTLTPAAKKPNPKIVSKPQTVASTNLLNPIKSIDGKTYTKLNKVQLNSINNIALLNTKKNPNNAEIKIQSLD